MMTLRIIRLSTNSKITVATRIESAVTALLTSGDRSMSLKLNEGITLS
jgi:hypothetical protein